MTIDTTTALCGIIGKPILHSLSPAIHNAAAEYHKLNFIFLAFETENPKGAISAMRTLSIRELTVTIPYKEVVMKYVDCVEERARELGNINTIINDKGVLKGYNTDIDGVAESLHGIPLKNQSVVIFGSGGVARTIFWYVAKNGGKVYVFGRDKSAGRRLAKSYGGIFETLEDVEKKILNINPRVIINATPVGMGELKDKSLVPTKVLKRGMAIFDAIYNPKETRLLKDAARAGCRVIGGRKMFLLQGARQFELWSGKRAPIRVMERAFDKALSI